MTRNYLTTGLLAALLLLVFAHIGIAAQYNEPPLLAERVMKGELPPIDQRLPENPFVVGPGVLIVEDDLDWEVGKYGGTLRTTHSTADWDPDIFMMANQPIIMAPGIDLDGMRGNIV